MMHGTINIKKHKIHPSDNRVFCPPKHMQFRVSKAIEQAYPIFNILFTVHPNIKIVFFTNLIQKFFILIHLLHSSTCFGQYYAHPQGVKLC